MIIRRERPGDEAAARAVHVAAFRRPTAEGEPIEAWLLDELRRCEGWIPALSMVAEVDGSIVGHDRVELMHA